MKTSPINSPNTKLGFSTSIRTRSQTDARKEGFTMISKISKRHDHTLDLEPEKKKSKPPEKQREPEAPKSSKKLDWKQAERKRLEELAKERSKEWWENEDEDEEEEEVEVKKVV